MGLVALWWESLLAKSVLEGKTTDYINHPQLICFRNYVKPLQAINTYLMYINEEAKKRGFAFDPKKILCKFRKSDNNRFFIMNRAALQAF
ncbi:MAG: pyrimidine dimer DNA glycosylase/endonuclease V [Candidatus Micrarchaeia archaeon]